MAKAELTLVVDEAMVRRVGAQMLEEVRANLMDAAQNVRPDVTREWLTHWLAEHFEPFRPAGGSS